MTPTSFHPPLTNLQIELLKLFSRSIPEADLMTIRDMIARFLLEKSFDYADEAWDEKGYTLEKFNEKMNGVN
jgi:hypothetical protein